MNFEKNVWLIIKFIVTLLVTGLISIIGVIIFIPIADFLLRNEPTSLPAAKGIAVAFIAIFMSFGFFYCLSSVFVQKKIKYFFLVVVIIIMLSLVYLMDLGSGNLYSEANFRIITILIPTMIAGWLIGEGIVRLYKMIKKTN